MLYKYSNIVLKLLGNTATNHGRYLISLKVCRKHWIFLKYLLTWLASRIWNFAWWKYDMERFAVTPCNHYLWMSWGSFDQYALNVFFLQKTIRAYWSKRRVELTNGCFQNHPNSLEIVITWCYGKPFHNMISVLLTLGRLWKKQLSLFISKKRFLCYLKHTCEVVRIAAASK